MPSYKEDQNGYVTFPDTTLSKPGVFPYMGREISPDLEPDKIYYVWRPESELNNPETIESFKLSPWFPRHEMAGDEFTAAEEIGVQGTTGQDVRYVEGQGLVATVKTFGTRLKAAINAGLRELSCGFRCTWEVISGTTPDGVQYDVVQRNIRGNHLASVDEGRMGPQVSLAMDRACIALDNLQPDKGENMTLEEMMEKVREAQPAKEELAKVRDEINKMLGEGGEPDPEGEPEGGEGYDQEDTPVDPEKPAMDKDKPDAAMDEMKAQLEAMKKELAGVKGQALDAATVEKMITEKNNLISDLEPVVGKIDGTGLDANGVASKAADILGIACDSSSALASVRGYLHAQKNQKTTVDNGHAQDGEPAEAVSKQLDEMGL